MGKFQNTILRKLKWCSFLFSAFSCLLKTHFFHEVLARVHSRLKWSQQALCLQGLKEATEWGREMPGVAWFLSNVSVHFTSLDGSSVVSNGDGRRPADRLSPEVRESPTSSQELKFIDMQMISCQGLSLAAFNRHLCTHWCLWSLRYSCL